MADGFCAGGIYFKGIMAVKNEIVLFTDGEINLEVPVTPDNEQVWLSLDQMCEPFQSNKSTTSIH